MTAYAHRILEYNEVQCDKRNTYRRKVKEEKAAAATVTEGDDASKDGDVMESTNGVLNGHDGGDDEDRPAKKLKAEDGSALAPGADGLNDDDMQDDPEEEQEVYEHQEEDEEDDDVDDEDDDEHDGSAAALVGDAEPDEMAASRMQLQELDSDVDSDSD